jgi:hypothetical protein
MAEWQEELDQMLYGDSSEMAEVSEMIYGKEDTEEGEQNESD